MGESTVETSVLICVVDDDPSVGRALARLARSLGFHAASFTSGEEYLRANHLHAADCLVLDVHLSGMTGFELQQRLTARHIATPVIFMTADDDVMTRERALKAGAIAFLHKPFEEGALVAAIRKAITTTP
jgi:FixJ family two-component response regulator